MGTPQRQRQLGDRTNRGLRVVREARHWPRGWDLALERCRGLSGRGAQCRRTAARDSLWCVAHRHQTPDLVRRRAPAVVVTERWSAAAVAIPRQRRCRHRVLIGSGATRRCGNWTLRIPDGTFDSCCAAHTRHAGYRDHVRAERERRRYVAWAWRVRVLDPLPMTPDEVQTARWHLMVKLEVGAIGPAVATVIGAWLNRRIDALDAAGLLPREGGAGVRRVLPGETLESHGVRPEQILSKEEFEALHSGMLEDERNGIETPSEFVEICARYLRSRQDQPRDPAS